MDGPSVSFKFLQKVKDQRKKLSYPGLTNCASCSLHTVHKLFKFEVESTGCNEELFSALEGFASLV